MRYVGRHRAPRPLLLRRPVVGGVAAAAVLAVPVLYATGNFSNGLQNTPTRQIADGTKITSSPAGAETGSADIVIPTDGSVIPTSGATATSVATATGIGLGGTNGVGIGAGGGSSNRTHPATTTTRPGSKPTKTTTKPTKTTTKPPKTKPPVVTTEPPVVTTDPPVETTDPPVETTAPAP